MEKSRLVWGLGLMGVVSLLSLQGCSDDATAGDTNTGGTTGGSVGSGGSSGGAAGSGNGSGGSAGASGGSAGKGGGAGSGGTTGGSAGSGGGAGTGGSSGGSGGGGSGGTSGAGGAGSGGGGTGGGGGSGGNANAAKCMSYCDTFETKCPMLYGTDYSGDTCESTCAGWQLGTQGATSGNNIECRITHAGLASGMNDSTHCGHASKNATAGGCQ